MSGRDEVTQILGEMAAGDRSAADRLLPLVYAELRALAAAVFREEREGHTLQPTALVHEAFLRMVGAGTMMQPGGKAHFMALAARVMRQLLVDHARAKKAAKRDPGAKVQGLTVVLEQTPAADAIPERDVLDLDEALAELAREYPRAAQVVELRFFGGMLVEDIALLLNLNRATVDRDWALARGWLNRRLKQGSAG